MSVFRTKRHNEVWMDPDKTIAKGTTDNNPHAFSGTPSSSADASASNPGAADRPPRVQPAATHWSNTLEGDEQDAIRTAPLTPIPDPGLAVFPAHLNNDGLRPKRLLMMKPNWKKKGFDVTDITDRKDGGGGAGGEGYAMFSIANPNPNLKPNSSKRVFSDANTGAKLCVFEKETLKWHAVYRATEPSNSKKVLVEVRVKKSSDEITASVSVPGAVTTPTGTGVSKDSNGFSNEIISDDGGKDKKQTGAALEYKGHATELRGTIEYAGALVATIEKKFLITSTEYHLRIVRGLDPFLVVVLAQAVEDRRRMSDTMTPFGLGGIGNIA